MIKKFICNCSKFQGELLKGVFKGLAIGDPVLKISQIDTIGDLLDISSGEMVGIYKEGPVTYKGTPIHFDPLIDEE